MNAHLTVTVHGKAVGDLVAEGGEYIFTYRSDAAETVSLTMPVRSKGYVFPRVHPLFEMHLPEGYLLRFGQASCDLTLKQAEALYDQCLHALEQVNNALTQRLKHEKEPDKVHVLQHLAQRTQV